MSKEVGARARIHLFCDRHLHSQLSMAPYIRDCCLLMTGALVATLVPAVLPFFLDAFPYRSLASLAQSLRHGSFARARPVSRLEELPLEILEQVLSYCHADDVSRIALTSPRLAYLTRRYRWTKLSIRPGEAYYNLREWSLQSAMAGTQSKPTTVFRSEYI